MVALDIYGSYLAGQTSGFSDALSLPAVVAAFAIEGIPRGERPDLARRLVLIHAVVMERARAREKTARRG
jgi:hypothetical protein